MSTIKSWARKGLSLATAAGLTATTIMAMPLAANADPTVVTFSSTDAANYAYLAHRGGNGGILWAPWTDAEALNAPQIVGASNWNGREGWSTRNYVVQDDGSGSNNALWIQKAKAGCPTSGIQIAALDSASSMITSTNKVITLKFKAWDDSVPVQAILEDSTDGNDLVVTATATTKEIYNTLSFDFASPTSGTYSTDVAYSKLTLVIDPSNAIAGTGTDWAGCGDGAAVSKAYLVDDLTYTVGAATPPPPPATDPYKLTFEDNDLVGSLAYGDITGEKAAGQFEGGGTGQGTPPVARSGKALQFNKAAAGQDWSGFLAFVAGDGAVLTSSTYKTISFDYYSPDAVASPLQMKIETADQSAAEKTFVANQGWNSFTIDVSTMSGYSADKQYKKLVFIPNFGTAEGATIAAKTDQKYYFDNIVFNGWGKAVRTAANTISGTAKSGRTLTASTGTWTGNGVTYNYQWYRCTKSSSSTKLSSPSSSDKCSALRGKTAATYKLTSSDRGKYIRVRVKATTQAGYVYSTSKSTSRVR